MTPTPVVRSRANLGMLRWCSEEAPEHDQNCHDHYYHYGGDSDSFRTHRVRDRGPCAGVGYPVPRWLFVSGGIPYQPKHGHGNERLAAAAYLNNGCSDDRWLVFGRLLNPWECQDLLAMIASVEAIFLSTFVLISQNRMAAAADKRADLDLQISLLAEHEVTSLVTLLSGR